MKYTIPFVLLLASCAVAAEAEAPAPTTTTTTSTTTTTTTVEVAPPPTVTTTTTTIPAGDWLCPEWIGLATEAGFPAEVLPTVDAVIHRESTCNPDAFNGEDPNGGSRGLTQVNGIWLDWFLPDMGIAHTTDDLFDPLTNLRAAHAIWQRQNHTFAAWGL